MRPITSWTQKLPQMSPDHIARIASPFDQPSHELLA